MDKYVTRMANMGKTKLLMFNRWWDLSPGAWSIKFDRDSPGKSKLWKHK